MTDFYQMGLVPTLHALYPAEARESYLDALESQIATHARHRHITLLLPCLFSELSNGRVLENIIQQLKPVRYLSSIVVALGGTDRQTDFTKAQTYFKRLENADREVTLVWVDGPRMRSFLDELGRQGISVGSKGKGQSVWLSLGYIFADGRADLVALHDCDIASYDRLLLARLIEPVAGPWNAYEFSKGYYARVSPATRTMHGRVTRLFVAPFLEALSNLFLTAPNDHLARYFNFHRAFRYILAGEFCFSTRLGRNLNIAYDWALEVSTLSEVFNRVTLRNICQVDLGINYEHKHQSLSANNHSSGLHRMVVDIAKYYLSYMRSHGRPIDDALVEAVRQTYYQTALGYVKIYSDDAWVNGLVYDRFQEEQTVKHFRDFIRTAWEQCRDQVEGTQIPSWNRIMFSLPDVDRMIVQAVQEDAN